MAEERSTCASELLIRNQQYIYEKFKSQNQWKFEAFLSEICDMISTAWLLLQTSGMALKDATIITGFPNCSPEGTSVRSHLWARRLLGGAKCDLDLPALRDPHLPSADIEPWSTCKSLLLVFIYGVNRFSETYVLNAKHRSGIPYPRFPLHLARTSLKPEECRRAIEGTPELGQTNGFTISHSERVETNEHFETA